MLFIEAFDTFLVEEVNLNRSRIDTLVSRVSTIEGFITASSWQPTITRYSRQGSWAHKTIIKPPGNGGFDADVLIIVEHVPGWDAEDYVLKLKEVFNGSGTYKDKAGLGNRCVTLEYSGDFEIDIVPCVVNRPGRTSNFEVCNRRDNKFEATDSEAYRKQIRRLFDEIKDAHGQGATINVFPAIPASCAVETGRVRMPKADLPLVIYDQVPIKGFVSRLTVG